MKRLNLHTIHQEPKDQNFFYLEAKEKAPTSKKKKKVKKDAPQKTHTIEN